MRNKITNIFFLFLVSIVFQYLLVSLSGIPFLFYPLITGLMLLNYYGIITLPFFILTTFISYLMIYHLPLQNSLLITFNSTLIIIFSLIFKKVIKWDRKIRTNTALLSFIVYGCLFPLLITLACIYLEKKLNIHNNNLTTSNRYIFSTFFGIISFGIPLFFLFTGINTFKAYIISKEKRTKFIIKFIQWSLIFLIYIHVVFYFSQSYSEKILFVGCASLFFAIRFGLYPTALFNVTSITGISIGVIVFYKNDVNGISEYSAEIMHSFITMTLLFGSSLIVARSVTDNKKKLHEKDKNEKVLIENNNYVRSILNCTNEAIFIHDSKTGKIIHVNDRMLEIYCLQKENIASLSMEKISSNNPGYTEKDAIEIINTIQLNKRISFLWEAKRSTGELFWAEVSLIRTELRGEEQVIATVYDITERKQQNDETLRIRTYLNTILNSMPSIIIGLDEDLTIILFNEFAEKELGFLSVEVMGNNLTTLNSHYETYIPYINQTMSTGKLYSLEKQKTINDNSISYEDVIIFPINLANSKGVVLKIDDVSSKVKLMEAMLQTEKMMSIGGLAAGMAHEINNPLAIILQGIQNTTRRLDPLIEKNQIEAIDCGTDIEKINNYLIRRNIMSYINGIKEASERSAKIVRNMLEFSRTPADIKVRVTICDLIDTVLDISNSDYDAVKSHDFKLIKIIKNYNIPKIELMVYKTELEQVLLNILKNATYAVYEKFHTNENGVITITVGYTGTSKNMITIAISDNGSGMKEEQLKRIFEPFFTTKAPGQGTGLGLSVSYFIIKEKHNGSIFAESIEGKGSTFFIELPIGT